MKLSQTLVLITGASRGIGKGIALALAKREARVILLSRTQSDLDQVADEIKEIGSKAWTYSVDLSNPEAVDSVSERIKKEVGVPEVIVNSAGQGRFLFLEETPAEEAVHTMALPYFAAFYVTRAFLPEMLERKKGLVIHIGSPASILPWPGATAYTAARWALRGFHEALRADFRGTGLKSSLVLPAKVKSSYFEANPESEQRLPKIAKWIRTLTPEEVGHSVADTIENEKQFVLIPFTLRVLYSLTALMPGVIEWVVYRTGWKRQ